MTQRPAHLLELIFQLTSVIAGRNFDGEVRDVDFAVLRHTGYIQYDAAARRERWAGY